MMPLLARVAGGIALLFLLGGCASSPLSQFVAQSHSAYEAAYLRGGVSRPSSEEARPRSARKGAQASAPQTTTTRTPVAMTPPRRPAEIESGNTGSAGPLTTGSTRPLMEPMIGSPEWEREEVQRKQRDRDVERAMRSICSRC